MKCAAFIVTAFAITWAWADCMIAFAQTASGSNATQAPARSPHGPQGSRSAEPFQSASPEQRSSSPYILKVPRGSRAPLQARTSDGDAEQVETTRPRVMGPDLADIRARLNNAQAKGGDVQVSLAWNTVDDIDLHVQYRVPEGQTATLWYGQRFDGRGGMLDVDMNAGGALSSRPVENIFWPKGSSPTGEFVVRVHHFRLRAARTVPVTVIIKVDSEERLFNVNCVYGLPPQEVFRFQKRDP